MNNKSNTTSKRLKHFSELYEKAKSAYAENLDRFDKYMSQYKGSRSIDGSSTPASTTRNITYEIIESQISSDIPAPKVDAATYSEGKERCAQTIEKLLRALRDRLPYEEINDMDERYTYIFGGSVFLVEWDNQSSNHKETGEIKLSLISPRDFIPQPAVYSVEDMDYCFIRFTTTPSELIRKYGIQESKLLLADYDGDESSWDETVSLILTFYKDEDGNIGRFIFSGDLVLSDEPDYYARKIGYCKDCGSREDACLCGGVKRIYKTIDTEYITSPDLSHKTAIPYYKPREFPIVIRKNTSGENCLFGQSDCEYIRPEQQAINKIESRILQKLLKAGITPIVPEDANITVNNSVFGQVIKMKPGETTAQYGTVDTTPSIAQDIAEAERLYDHAKRTLGITDAFQGISDNASESGYARQLRISQASGRLESKKKMKHTAYSKIDKMIFLHYLAFADEPRIVGYKDAFGRTHNQKFSKYDFLEYDPYKVCYFYDDEFLFSVDLNGGSEYQRESLWQRNLENLRSGTLGPPTEYATLLRYWQCQERAHYPHARENVEYFLELAKKGGVTDDGKKEKVAEK